MSGNVALERAHRAAATQCVMRRHSPTVVSVCVHDRLFAYGVYQLQSRVLRARPVHTEISQFRLGSAVWTQSHCVAWPALDRDSHDGPSEFE